MGAIRPARWLVGMRKATRLIASPSGMPIERIVCSHMGQV